MEMDLPVAVILLLFLIVDSRSSVIADQPCVAAYKGYDSIVCVCNATYCDTLSPEKPVGQWGILYTTSRDGLRLQKTRVRFSPNVSANTTQGTTFALNSTVRYQMMFGFGGAMTDSAGITISSLSRNAQIQLLRSYFSGDGSMYNTIRVPIAGTDFSTHKYTYDDYPNDTTLSQFRLSEEDFKYKIPLINLAQFVSPNKLNLLACPWSAPDWMKIQNGTDGPRLPTNTNGTEGKSYLNPKYYQTYANYLIRFLIEYQKRGFSFWALSTQNEPSVGLVNIAGWNSMGWTADRQRDFVINYMGPTLERWGFKDVPILIFDDIRDFLVSWTLTVLSDARAMRYVNSIGVHWYNDSLTPPEILDTTHNNFPNKMIFYTENCIVASPGDQNVMLGYWKRAEDYAANMIQVMTRWVAGWLDWNLALNLEGGPTWANNMVDASIIVNASADEFYKQPQYYFIYHLSKFVPANSYRIKHDSKNDDGIDSVAFKVPTGEEVLVMLNKNDSPIVATVMACRRGQATITLPPRSISTFTCSAVPYRDRML